MCVRVAARVFVFVHSPCEHRFCRRRKQHNAQRVTIKKYRATAVVILESVGGVGKGFYRAHAATCQENPHLLVLSQCCTLPMRDTSSVNSYRTLDFQRLAAYSQQV